MTPGPTELHPKVLQAMTTPILNHRKDEFKVILKNVRGQLGVMLKAPQAQVALLACSGSGGLEAALTATVKPGEKVIVINGGKFGQRFIDIAKLHGMVPIELKAEWGKSVPVAEVKAALEANPDAKAVCVQGSETSTATRHDVEGISALTRNHPSALLIVDAITMLGCQPLEMGAWGIDLVVGGSQKAFMLPPGLAFAAAGPRAVARMAEVPKRGYYLDLAKELKKQADGETAYTPAITIVMGMAAALEVMLEKGPDDFVKNAHLQGEMTRAAAKALGLELFSSAPADSCTAIRIPDAPGGAAVVKSLQNDFGLLVAGGQDQLKGKIIRIAHLGWYDVLDTIGAIAALELALKKLGHPVTVGAGVAAAQQRHLELS